MHEGAAIWLFEFFLSEPAGSTILPKIEADDGITLLKSMQMLKSCPEVINSLLETYATNEVLAEANHGLTTHRQSSAVA